MKVSSIQRWLFEFINLVLVVTFTIPLSLLLGWFFHYDAPWILWLLSVTVLGYLAGRMTMRADALQAQIVCYSVAIACGIFVARILHIFTGGFLLHLTGNVVYVALATFGSIGFFFCARKAGYTIYAPMSTVGLILHILSLIVVSALDMTEQIRTVTSVAGILFFVLSLYAFNANGLRKSVHADERAKSARLPHGIQMSSFLLVTGFVLLTVLLSWIGPAIPVLAVGIGKAFLLVFRLVGWLVGLADSLGNTGVQAQTDSSAEETSLADFMGDGAKDQSAFWNSVVNVFGFLVITILSIVLLYLFYKKFLKGVKGVQQLLNRLRGMFEPEHVEDYEDEEESLFSWKKALDSASEGLRNVLRKVTDRPQKYDDFQTGRLKIRFVYQQLLRQRMGGDGGAVGRYETPNELLEHLPSDADAFIESYNGVRYADQEPSSKQLSLAKALLPKK